MAGLGKILTEYVVSITTAPEGLAPLLKALQGQLWAAVQKILAEAEHYPPSREALDLLEMRLMTAFYEVVPQAYRKIEEKLAKEVFGYVRAANSICREALGQGKASEAIQRAIAEGTRMKLSELVLGGKTMEERFYEIIADAAKRLGDRFRERWTQEFSAALYQGYGGAEAAYVAARQAGWDITKKEFMETVGEKTVQRIERLYGDYLARGLDQATVDAAMQHRDVIVGLQWTAMMDRMVCPACAALDGKRWYFETEVPENHISRMPTIPLHPNCRCAKVPVLSPEVEPHKEHHKSFRQWFAKLPEEDQRRILGNKRFQLYQAGIPLSELVDERGKLVPVEKLQGLLEKAKAAQVQQPYAAAPWHPDDYETTFSRTEEALQACWPPGVAERLRALRTPESAHILQALQAYQEQAYEVWNAGMAGKPLRTTHMRRFQQELPKIRALEQFMRAEKSLRLKRDLVVYRGTSERVMDEILRPGAILRNPCFTSTSLNRQVAETFARDVLVEIRVPAGTPALMPFYATGEYQREAEVLLPPGAILRIDGIREEGYMKIVQATLVEVEK